jgi:uncharacterized ParB-like nuclease family protein
VYMLCLSSGRRPLATSLLDMNTDTAMANKLNGRTCNTTSEGLRSS